MGFQNPPKTSTIRPRENVMEKGIEEGRQSHYVPEPFLYRSYSEVVHYGSSSA
jgi:hypothetical protein